jgi:hypothetical protein
VQYHISQWYSCIKDGGEKAEAVFLGGYQQIFEVNKDVKKCKTVRKCGISRSMLSTFIKNNTKIEKNTDTDATELQRRQIQVADYDQVDQAMCKWSAEKRWK